MKGCQCHYHTSLQHWCLPDEKITTIKYYSAFEQTKMVLLDLVASFTTLDIGSKPPSYSKDAIERIIGSPITSD